MSRTLAGLAAIALAAAPAAAAGYGWSADYSRTGALPAVGSIEVSVNPAIVKETSFVTQRTSTGQMYIAPRDAEDLSDTLREEIQKSLTAAGEYTAGAPGKLVVVIDEASPSNPAHTQNGRNQNLDFRSAGRGGATILADLQGADGAKLASFTYRWEESTFDFEITPRIGWFGAERAFDRFSHRLARELAEDQAPGAS